MKKRLSAAVLAAVLLLGLAGCGAGRGLRIVTTVFPVYDWVRVILGDGTGAELVCLADGENMHDYQPSDEDLKAISDCDVFIFIGGASEAWAEQALSEARNGKMIVINLMETIGTEVRLEERGDGSGAYDEHIWLSPQNARMAVAYIAAVLGVADPKNADTYGQNADTYGYELMLLDAAYVSAVREAAVKSLAFGGAFPFRYLTEAYGLEAYSAYPDCPARGDTDAAGIATLAGKADELGLPVILAAGEADRAAAQSLADLMLSDPAVLVLEPMDESPAEGATYLSVMEDNLTVLRQALGAK